MFDKLEELREKKNQLQDQWKLDEIERREEKIGERDT